VVAPDLVTSVPVTRRALTGDALALAGAVTAACYYTIGRRVRGTLDVWPYVTLVYGACLVTLVMLALALRVPIVPDASREYLIFALLALGPMLLGHTGMNWALKHARAYQVNIVLLGEPVVATLLAAVIPGIEETPTVWTIAGGVLVLTGILLAERQRRS
jgi:drug/metabolite transporter (DMT)-like permease